MLTQTFLHVRGVGERTERRIWAAGVVSWDAFSRSQSEVGLSASMTVRVLRELKASARALERRDSSFFARALPPALQWRVYREFRDDAAFLDIETTGLADHNYTTAVAVLDRQGLHSFVKGRNLPDLPGFLSQYRLLVTYNGRCFDVPFLVHEFPNLPAPLAHVDLRFLLAKLGLRGGLKRVEAQLGLAREGPLGELDGYAAVLLWQRHLAGDPRALDCLVRYNQEDVARLRYLADYAYNRLASQMPIEAAGIPAQEEPVSEAPFHEDLVREILATRFR